MDMLSERDALLWIISDQLVGSGLSKDAQDPSEITHSFTTFLQTAKCFKQRVGLSEQSKIQDLLAKHR